MMCVAMGSDSKRKITASFMIGYFISFMKNELSENENRLNGYHNFLITMMSHEILSTMSDLFQEVFNESITDKYSVISRNDLKDTLTEIFELVSEKIQRGGESFLEISFFCGGFLSLAETEENIFFDREKLEVILNNLLVSLEYNLCWNDLNKIIRELTSGCIQSRRESRDQLLSLICSNQKSHKRIFEIQNLFEMNTYNQNTAFA